MLYMNGTIIRDDGKRMTEKRGNDLFDAFLEWLDESQGCSFGGSFDPTYRDGQRLPPDTTRTAAGRSLTVREGHWVVPEPKKTKRKKKR